MFEIKRLNTIDNHFWTTLEQQLAWQHLADDTIIATVRDILRHVQQAGDEAVLHYTQTFDNRILQNIQEASIPSARLQQALLSLPRHQREALETAAKRIRDYHQHQRQESWHYQDEYGNLLGMQITPMERVGVYVPGGKAAYPSSVLMNVIPAKVAGVDEIIMTVPAPNGFINDMVLAAAAIAEVDHVFTIGGAQAIAALAYGTATIPKVDKIVGPGNIYVATAKSMVYGSVGIDMIAGPSEILVLCDGDSDPDWIAMDLFSQAEHDELARAILVCPRPEFLDAVQNSMYSLINQLPRATIIQTALQQQGLFIQVRDLNEAIDVANFVASEHLELSITDPQSILSKIRHAGAIFMGRYTAEALGDYCVGANHVLPTSRTARFSSPLGVYDFQKRSSVIMCTENGAQQLGKIASILADGEGLTAHARSAEYRIMQNILKENPRA